MTESTLASLGKGTSTQRRGRINQGPLAIDLERREAIVSGAAVSLTKMEFKLLQTLMEAPGRTFSRDELISRLHMLDGKTPTDRSLDNLVVRLRRKLGDNPRRPKLIRAVWGIGYRLITPATDAWLELATQAIDLLPVPTLLLDGKRIVVAANALAQRALGHIPEGVACYDLLHCPLQNDCGALETMTHRVPVSRGYTIRTSSGPTATRATYLPLAAGGATLCLMVLAPSKLRID